MTSALIVFDILRILETKNEKAHHRVLLGLSCSDIIAFFCHFMSTWPIPRGASIYGAIGNEVSCKVQGFIVQLSIASPLYNTALSVYYLLAIRHKFSECEIRKLEPWMHCFTIIFSFSTAMLGLALDLYKEARFGCWIASESKDEFLIFQIAMWLAPLSISLIVITTSQISIVMEVREAERSGRRFSTSRRRSWTDQVCKQSFWYVGTFYATWIVPGIFLFLWKFSSNKYSAQWFGIPVALLTPLQGCFNAMVYFRPRYIRYKRKHPEAAIKMILVSTFRKALPICKSNLSEDNT